MLVSVLGDRYRVRVADDGSVVRAVAALGTGEGRDRCADLDRDERASPIEDAVDTRAAVEDAIGH